MQKIKIDGVIEKEGETYNQKWLLETIHSGKNKTMGSLSEPVTQEQRQIMQTISAILKDLLSKKRVTFPAFIYDGDLR